MLDLPHFLTYFVSLLVVTNPLSALPAVLRITRGQNLAEKRQTGLTTAMAVGVILLISTWGGTPILNLLGIQLSAFQVAGGFVLFLLALSMLSAEESPVKSTEEEAKDKSIDSGAIVPLAIPIIAGPGAISAVIVSVDQYPGLVNQLILSCAALLVAFVMGMILYFASNLEKMLGRSGINVINRLGGLILAAIAIQTMAAGIRVLFSIGT